MITQGGYEISAQGGFGAASKFDEGARDISRDEGQGLNQIGGGGGISTPALTIEGTRI